MRAALLSLFVTSGCFAVDLGDGLVQCNPNPVKSCAPGFHCASDGFCWRDGHDPDLGMTSGNPDIGSASNDLSNFEGVHLTIGTIGPAAGHVSSTPVGIDCGNSCDAPFAGGTSVTLTARADSGFMFRGWSGDCTGLSDCMLTVEGTRNVTATFTAYNLVFATSATYKPTEIASLSNADAKCQQLAAGAGLPGTYRAWLSTTSGPVHAKDRLGAARGWTRVDGRPFADSVATLTQGKILYPIGLDETGAGTGLTTVGAAVAWTGTNDNGTVGMTCSDWMSNTGLGGAGTAGGGTHAWTAVDVSHGCSNSDRLLCFGIDLTNVMPPQSAMGRKAFLSPTTSFPGTNGLSQADTLCAMRGAGLGGTFKALLATESMSAAARFDTSAGSAPWVRVDGVQLVQSASDLSTGTFLAPLDVDADGTYLVADLFSAWTGTHGTPSTLSNAGLACTAGGNAWTSTSSADVGGVGCAAIANEWFTTNSAACNVSTPSFVYCLQQ